MSNRTYDILNIIVKVVIPAVITFLGVVFSTYGYQYSELVMAGVALIETVLGGILTYVNQKYFDDKEIVDKEENFYV